MMPTVINGTNVAVALTKLRDIFNKSLRPTTEIKAVSLTNVKISMLIHGKVSMICCGNNNV